MPASQVSIEASLNRHGERIRVYRSDRCASCRRLFLLFVLVSAAFDDAETKLDGFQSLAPRPRQLTPYHVACCVSCRVVVVVVVVSSVAVTGTGQGSFPVEADLQSVVERTRLAQQGAESGRVVAERGCQTCGGSWGGLLR